jgi:uncharacterized protein (TIGR03580 family)
MPIVFWMAAVDAGRRSGIWGTVLGGLAHIVMGNAVPGIVLGIVVGKGVDDSGWNKITRTIATAVILLFVCSAILRGVDLQALQSMHIPVPGWLQEFHQSTKTSGS